MAPHDRFDEVGYFVVPERVGRPPPQLETREDGRAASPRASRTSPHHVRPLRSPGPALHGTPDAPSRRWALGAGHLFSLVKSNDHRPRCRSRTSDGAGAWWTWRLPSCTPRASATSDSHAARRQPPRAGFAAADASGTANTPRSRWNLCRPSSRMRACSGARTIQPRASLPASGASGGRRGGTFPPSSGPHTTTRARHTNPRRHQGSTPTGGPRPWPCQPPSWAR